MPNHVTNIMNPLNAAAKAFIVEQALGVFSFENFVPGYPRTGQGWYKWSIKFWGTKWDAYDVRIEGTIQFDTAWSTPLPVYEAIAKKYPDARFRVLFADEDIGSNLGVINIYDGQCDFIPYEDKSDIKKCSLFLEMKLQDREDWYVHDEYGLINPEVLTNIQEDILYHKEKNNAKH